MKQTRTECKVFTVAEVMEHLTGTVTLGSGNFTHLITYLTTPGLASKIEMYKEVNLKLYFNIGGYWFKENEDFNSLPKPNAILLEVDKLEPHEVEDRIDYCMEKSFAAKQIIRFFNNVQVNKYKKSIKTSQSWYFAKCGGAVRDDSDIRHYPVRKIRPRIIFKKHLLNELRKERTDWENAVVELQKIHGE